MEIFMILPVIFDGRCNACSFKYQFGRMDIKDVKIRSAKTNTQGVFYTCNQQCFTAEIFSERGF
jgi:hypothetical protein